MKASDEEHEFFEKLRVFVYKEGYEIDPQYVAGVLLAMGAVICKVTALNHETPIGTLMEYINLCINHGLTQGAEMCERMKK